MKHLLLSLTIITLLSITACNIPAHPNSGTSEQVARNMFAAFNRHDWKQMADYYSDSALFLDPSLGKEPVYQTRQQIIKKYTELAALFPDIKDDVRQVYASGDHVTVEFVSSASSDSTGAWQLPICTVLTIQNGKIIRDATYYDQE
ncbi:nuclear transport factor 2 family protein [Filimonas lacunae]|nr:nuclear transport factor 2 family protein [Filimonas lacunae]